MNTVIRLLLLYVLAIFSVQSWGISAKEVSNCQYDVDSQCLNIDVNTTDVSLQVQNYGYDCIQNLSYYCDNRSTESQEDYGNLGYFIVTKRGTTVIAAGDGQTQIN